MYCVVCFFSLVLVYLATRSTSLRPTHMEEIEDIRRESSAPLVRLRTLFVLLLSKRDLISVERRCNGETYYST